MRKWCAACRLSPVLMVLLLGACAMVEEEKGPVASAPPAPSEAKAPPARPEPPAGSVPADEQAALSAVLAREAARDRKASQATPPAGASAPAPQERPLTREEVEAQVAAMKPRKAPPARKPAAQPEVAVEAAAAPVTPPPAAEQPASPNVFRVSSGLKDPAHPFYGVGSKYGFAVNGVQGKPLVLVRGKTYTFKVNTDVQHDFYISRSKTGWGAATYTHGVEGNFTYNGIVTITPDQNTPDVLYYQCRNHKNMGGAIHVVNSEAEAASLRKKLLAGATPKPGSAGAKAAARPGTSPPGVSREQVQQKLAFADMFINQSQAARRIAASGNADAFEMYRAAQTRFKEARAAMEGKAFKKALALVDESLRLMSEASRRVPSQASLESLKEQYDEMLEGARTFLASYERNSRRLAKRKRKDGKKLPGLDLAAIRGEIAAVEKLAADNEYAEAVRRLSKVQEQLNAALTEMLHQETMSYELVFETPKEEYEYELSRYLSYEELVPLAIEQRRPPKQTVDLMNRFVEKARGIKAQALPTAAKGDYKTAILMLQGATSHIQRALRLAGVR